MSPNPVLPVNTNTPLTPRSTGGCVEKKSNPKPESGGKDRARWRWADRRSEIESRGQVLGLGRWDEASFGNGGESFQRYAARVFAAHAAEQGVIVHPPDVERQLQGNANWSEVVRSLTAPQTKNDNDSEEPDVTTAVFTSTRQALHVSFLLEVMPATAKSQMQRRDRADHGAGGHQPGARAARANGGLPRA
jgi:hypothetical protein